MLFISPPFGNYIHLPNTKSIKGSYTLQPRTGLLKQIFKTLRYSYTMKGWVNKIGLRNKGLQYGISNYNHKSDILSIAILEQNEISPILKILPNNTNIELNISCPNTEKHLISNNLQSFLNPQREWCIIKLSPLVDTKLIDSYYKQGFRQFHCSNTIPIKKGGLSGQSIIPHNTRLINYIKNQYDDVIVIAGGGIQSINTLNAYKKMGANHFSVSTLFFSPFRAAFFFYKYNNN